MRRAERDGRFRPSLCWGYVVVNIRLFAYTATYRGLGIFGSVLTGGFLTAASSIRFKHIRQKSAHFR